jgi:enoyl-CoA hydratase/carnithine racemase
LTEEDFIEYSREGRIGWIRLNRPEKLNALTNEMMDRLLELLYEIDADDEVWICIIHGAGKAFCAGADVSRRLASAKARGVRPGARSSVLITRFDKAKPVITAVHGYTYGAGLRMVLQSELTVADETAKFQMSETNRGVDPLPLWQEMRTVTLGSFADDLAITGRSCDAQEALAKGLVHRVVGPGEHVDAARELAEQVLSMPPLAVRALVRARRARLEALDVNSTEITRAGALHLTNDFRESVAAFKEKRKPNFTAT